MKRNNSVALLAACIAMAVLILDAKTAISGARDGISLCIRSVIPSLFPFMILSAIICDALTGKKLGFLRPIGLLCGIPAGSEFIWLVGILGGYPIGAKCIADACSSSKLSAKDGQKMLAFCSNAGPSFLFGILGSLFHSTAAWALWGIHILSSLLTGFLLSEKTDAITAKTEYIKQSPNIIRSSISAMASICTWVILFRVIAAYIHRWFLWMLPVGLQVLTIGALELTNGCLMLCDLQHQGTQFVLASCMLSFGGLCVLMQTVSVTKTIGMGSYFPGKVLQTLISFLLSAMAQNLLFSSGEQCHIPLFVIIFSLFAVIFIYARKK